MIAEDIGENEVGSFSLKRAIAKPKAAKIQSTLKNQPIRVDEVDEDDSGQQPVVDEQDEFLFESYFSEKKGNSFKEDTEIIEPVSPDPTTPKKNKSKWSMSTDVKSSAGSGNLVNILNPKEIGTSNIDPVSLKY